MGYHYVALVGNDRPGRKPTLPDDRVALLRERGMRCVLATGAVAVYASPETPVLAYRDGVVIGHLFSRTGRAVGVAGLPAPDSAVRFAERLLADYWGDYLLVQEDGGTDGGLHVLRDPSGGVSCLHAIHEGSGFVTTDVSLARELGLLDTRIDWNFVAHALAYPHLTTTDTGLTGLNELLPGFSLEVRGTTSSVRQTWSPWHFVEAENRHDDPRETASLIRAAVDTAVKAWAATDIDLLVELSGGLDSSIVAMCLRESAARARCCTLVTPVPGADERAYAQDVADALGIELHAVALGFENALFDFELPVATARPGMTALQYVAHDAMNSAARALGTTSFFSGGGGDSVFCYLPDAVPAVDALKERGVPAAVTAIRDLSLLHQCTYWKAARLALKKSLRGAKTPCMPDLAFLHPSISNPEPARHPWFVAPEGALPGDCERIADLAGTQAFRESAPRGSTHWLRMPLLSQPVMEACLRAPSWMWIAGGQNRVLARAAFADRLPRSVLERRSKGTFMNYFGGIYQRNKAQMRNYLLGGRLQERGLLDAPALSAFVESPLPPRDTSFMRIFDLCMIENWARHQG